MDKSALLSTLQIISPTTSLILAGYCLAFSQNVVCLLYSLPSSISGQLFTRVCQVSERVVIPLSICSFLSSFCLAFITSEMNKRLLWIMAAINILLTRYMTAKVMGPGIKRLGAIAEGQKVEGREDQDEKTETEVELLLRDWVGQNRIRFAITFSSGIFGLSAAGMLQV